VIADLAARVAHELALGFRVCLIVGRPQDAEDYRQALLFYKSAGDVTVLVASQDNGRDWKSKSFDAPPHVCPSAFETELLAMRAHDLAREAAIRSPPKMGRPKKLPRELRSAIRRGRRAAG
jgi:hypothetical protein